jgi:hypothetical protein
MLIAVCLSGQLRNWRIGWENQKWFWTANKDFKVDFFAHTWDYSKDRSAISKPYTSRKVTEQEYREFIKSFGIIKGIRDTKHITEFQDSDHWGGLFYSFVNSIMLKREYEIEQGIEYDLVIKSRPDVVFHPDMFLYPQPYEDGVMYTTHGGLMPIEFNMVNFNDCVFAANSRTMDKLVNIFHYRMHKINVEEENVHPMGPGTLMNEYFRDFGLHPKASTLGFKETLLKEGCPEDLDLFNAKEFEKMDEYFRNWYVQ